MNKILVILIAFLLINCNTKDNNSPKFTKYYNNDEILDSMIVEFKNLNQKSIYKRVYNSSCFVLKNYKNNVLVSEGDFYNTELIKDSLLLLPHQYQQTYYKNSMLVHKRNIWTVDIFSRDRTSLYMTFDEKADVIKDSSHTFILNKQEAKLTIDLVSCCVSTNTLYLLDDKKLDSIVSLKKNKWQIDLVDYKNKNYVHGFIKNQNPIKLKNITGITNNKSEFLYMLN